MPKIDHLPVELLSSILGYLGEKDLYTCTLINKTFCNETTPLLWRRLDNIDSETTFSKITSTMATSPHSPGHHVKSILVAFELSDASLLTLIQHIPFVEELRLEMADNISDTSFQQVPQRCPRLTTLCINRAFDITHSSMVAIGQYCHQLSTIELILCTDVDADLLFDALRDCPLKDITLLLCHLNFPKNQHLFQSTALALHQHYQHRLTSLRIQDITDDHTPFITTANTYHLVWPRLTCLGLDACDTLDDIMILSFLQTHSQLQYLELGNSLMITDRTLDAIPVYLPHLKELRVHGIPRITASGICRLVKNCATLETGVYCDGCGIYPQDVDFPKDLDKRFYQLGVDFETQQDEMVWLASSAFGNTRGD